MPIKIRLLLIIVIAHSSYSYSQDGCLIGKTKEEILEKHPGSDDFRLVTNAEKYLTYNVTNSDGINAAFYFKDNICTNQMFYIVSKSDYIILTGLFKKAGYVFDSEQRIWENKTLTIKESIDNIEKSTFIYMYFYVKCK